MADFFEIDFLEVHTSKSGDAIAIRYEQNGFENVHVLDAGFASTGPSVTSHILEYYGTTHIDHLVVTHPDKDHAEGVVSVIEQMTVGVIWMLRPWQYAGELIDGFDTYNSIERLSSRLRSLYPYLSAIEDIALEREIEIKEPFQGARIGMFTVMAPTKERYLQLILDADRTPISTAKAQAGMLDAAMQVLYETARKVINLVKAAWGEEVFSTDPVSCENEMSIVQYANHVGKKILLTADAGPAALQEAIYYAPWVDLQLPGLDRFQVPHHGSRRNLTSAILDQLLGERLPEGTEERRFSAIISAASDDQDHPRNAVVRSIYHRGGKVATTERGTVRWSKNAPHRHGWSSVILKPYPEDQEG